MDKIPTPTDHQTAATDIATQLDEPTGHVIKQIERIIENLGEATAYESLAKAQALLAEGGILTQDGKRKRTPAGTYFFLVRGNITAAQHIAIWPEHRLPGHLRPPKYKPPRLPWSEARPLIASALLDPEGTAMSVKLTLIGRPGRIIEKEHVVITTLVSQITPSIPRGVPKAPEKPTVYLVFISRKQWDRVAKTIADDESAQLLVMGHPVLDQKTEAIVVLGQSVKIKDQK